MLKYNNVKPIKVVLILILIFTFNIIQCQIVIGTPTLGFTQACANQNFNIYEASFVFSPATSLDNSNQFIVELSDQNGNFDDPIQIHITEPGEITTSPGVIMFSIPEDTFGENYRIRIKSTDPLGTSAPSTAFAAYFKLQDSPFTINNLVSTGAYCTGGSYLLTIDNPGINNNDSPLNYPSLTFSWFRETGPTTSVFISDGPTLSVSQEGTYFVETNYGTCTSNSFSNRVTISEILSDNSETTINSSLGNPYCPEQGLTTLTTIGGDAYQWFKDGNAIPDAINQTYQTNESGLFEVQVDLGLCFVSGSINLISELFESSINVPEENMMFNGEVLNVTISHDAVSPTFEWFLNGVLITGENGDSINATEFGDYSVIISETTGCEGSRTHLFSISEEFDPFPDVEDIPNIVSPNGDMKNDKWILPQEYISGTNTEILIFDELGKEVLKTNNYLNDWPSIDLEISSTNKIYFYIITPPNGSEKKGTITVLK